jgi:hypothetical protein
MSDAVSYTLTITQDGPPSAPYGWLIRERPSGAITKSSFTTFETRIEALRDSSPAAAELVFNTPAGASGEGPAVPDDAHVASVNRGRFGQP